MPAFQLADDLTPAIGYIRVSMAREEMISPDLQRESITKWAQRTDHRIVDWVEDLDKTGRNFKRRIMGVIERVENGEARVIAVWKYSRFGRTRTGVPANLARVEKVGGQLLSATEEVDARTAIGRFQRGMIMEFNAFESDRAGEQWQETHQWRRDHGLPAVGGERFGYVWHQRKAIKPDGSISLQDERYEPIPEMTDLIDGLHRRYIAGETFRSLAHWLNSAGHQTIRGQLWTGKAVSRYMDSGFAAGYLRFHLQNCPQGSFPHECTSYELVKHPTLHHPTVISEETWQQYQERRDFTRTAAPRTRDAAYPFTGLVRCGLCGRSAMRKVDGRSHAVYTCQGRSDKGAMACAGTALIDHAIERKVKDFLAELVAEIDQEAKSHDQAAGGLPRQRNQNPSERRLRELEAALAKLEKSIGRHMKAYALADDDDANGELEKAYIATLKDFRADKASLSEEAARLRAHADAGGEEAQKAAAVSIAIGLLDEWGTLTPARLNALLRRVVGRIELLGNRKSGERTARVVPVWMV